MFRCAIYTNKSESNVVDTETQRLACQDFAVKSGFTVLEKRYDDFCEESIPALKRPAMQKLFDDIETCEVEYVISYALDCVTKSASELAKILRLFEGYRIFFFDLYPAEFSANGKQCGYATAIGSFMNKEK
ncbi:MAG: recombinase family protein [Wolbachia endosymbiont of Tyrophagus putrescentiae]|nr:recombinase family protein [Wolbachia endosymbiont of Tyrophagus putrescentiae]